MLQVPEYIRTLVPYSPGKPIEETQREYGIKRVVKLASNENPLGCSSQVKKAIRKHLKEIHRYPDSGGYHLKKTLANHLKTTPSHLILGNGSNEVIDLLIRTFSLPGDAILTSQAAFIAYRICAQVHGVKTYEVPLDSQLKFSPSDIIEKIKSHSEIKILFIANPNNPTGTYLNRDELFSLLRDLETLRGDSLCVVLDYAYWEYVTAKDLPSPSQILSTFPHVILLRTFSKVHGLSGLRLGYGQGLEEMISMMERIRQPFNINSLAQVAGKAALSDKSFVKKSISLNRDEKKFWESTLNEIKIPFWKSQGNFILADIGRALGCSGNQIYEECLQRGVIFRPVGNYGLPTALRISIGTKAENRFSAQVLKKVCLKLNPSRDRRSTH